MKTLLRIALVSLFASTLARAEIREARSMKDTVPWISPGTLVIFDLDNTVMEPDQELGSDQWFGDLVKQGTLSGLDSKTATQKALDAWMPVQGETRMHPVEPQTPAWIRSLQANGTRVLGLTARPGALARRTIAQLEEIRVDFTRSPVLPRNARIGSDTADVYYRGIVFVGPGHDKGLVLRTFLAQADYHPARIVFIDDKLSNVQNVENALNQTPIPHLSVRYGAADARVASYRRDIADVEWRVFQGSGVLISDPRAAKMLPRP